VEFLEIHRARVMEKMQARSVPDLVQMVMKLQGPLDTHRR
jgi:FixJ family two-component response regulator